MISSLTLSFQGNNPIFFSFAKEPVISLKSVKEKDNIMELFRIPMTRQAYIEMVQLTEDLLDLNNDDLEKDKWSFTWGQAFSVKRFYQHHFKPLHPQSP